MWYGIISTRWSRSGGHSINLQDIYHAFPGSNNERVKQVSLCGGVVRERKSDGIWLDMWGRRGVVQIQQDNLLNAVICKKCLKKMQQALVADKFLEKE